MRENIPSLTLFPRGDERSRMILHFPGSAFGMTPNGLTWTSGKSERSLWPLNPPLGLQDILRPYYSQRRLFPFSSHSPPSSPFLFQRRALPLVPLYQAQYLEILLGGWEGEWVSIQVLNFIHRGTLQEMANT